MYGDHQASLPGSYSTYKRHQWGRVLINTYTISALRLFTYTEGSECHQTKSTKWTTDSNCAGATNFLTIYTYVLRKYLCKNTSKYRLPWFHWLRHLRMLHFTYYKRPSAGYPLPVPQTQSQVVQMTLGEIGISVRNFFSISFYAPCSE